MELDPDQTFQAKAVARGECPYEALFVLRQYLMDSEWVSPGQEVMSIFEDENELEHFPHITGVQDYVKKNGLLIEIENESIEQAVLALTA